MHQKVPGYEARNGFQPSFTRLGEPVSDYPYPVTRRNQDHLGSVDEDLLHLSLLNQIKQQSLCLPELLTAHCS